MYGGGWVGVLGEGIGGGSNLHMYHRHSEKSEKWGPSSLSILCSLRETVKGFWRKVIRL